MTAATDIYNGATSLDALTPDQKRTLVAYHEAGHAVAAKILNRRFESISIVPSDTASGQVILIRPLWWEDALAGKLTPYRKEALLLDIMVLMAGAAAVDLHTGLRSGDGLDWWNFGAVGDAEEWVLLADLLTGGDGGQRQIVADDLRTREHPRREKSHF